MSFLGQMPNVRSPPLDDDSEPDDVFTLPRKHHLAIDEQLQRWKRAVFVLNAARRFRHTTRGDWAHRERIIHCLEKVTHAAPAAQRFQESIMKEDGSWGKASSLQGCDLVDVASEVSNLQHLDDPKVKPSSLGSWSTLPDRMASLVLDRNPHALEEFGGVEGVAHLLEASLQHGLKDDRQYIQKRREEFGSNAYPQRPFKPFYSFVFDACKDSTIIVLMVCALVSLLFGGYDGIDVALAVMVVVLVTSVSDYRQYLHSFKVSEGSRNIPATNVTRGGRRITQISIFELVVGDLVSLGMGDQVPADGLFVDGYSLSLDESRVTGESEPVCIDQYKMPYLLSGCRVVNGYGTMLVTGVGLRSARWDNLMAELGEDSRGEELTPLQVHLHGVATFNGRIGLCVAVLELLILLISYFTGHMDGVNRSGKFKLHHTSSSIVVKSVVDIIATASLVDIFASVLDAVRKGLPRLPQAVTLSLAYATKRMMAERALFRRVAACETMGSVTAICSDKTGILTSNMMTVVRVSSEDEVIRDADSHLLNISSDFASLLFEGIAQNSSASVFVPPDGREPEVTGSPTEKAVLMWGLRMGMNFDSVRSFSKILQVEGFNSVKKTAGVVVRVVESGKVHVHWKGAAEIVLGRCNTVLGASGSISPITSSKRGELVNHIEGMAAQSLRCIAFGYTEVLAEDQVPSGGEWKIPDGPLTLIAIVGIQDPCRPGVPEAVQKCRAAGIKVRMLTGDNLATAKAIATECGILVNDGGIAIEGSTFRNYSDEKRREELPRVVVLARSSPLDKHLMVHTLREMGEVVAVIGDGTNDAPVLHEADVGLAMGIHRTEVAKECSDIIILDDNFETVVKVVRWGRSIYANIQKFVQFQLTVNCAALAINFIAAVSSGGRDVPLTAVQLLWVNLIMGTLGALALATEPPTDELLQRPPVGRKEPLISSVMLRNVLVQATYQIGVLAILHFKGKKLLRLEGEGRSTHEDATQINNTVIFNAFVLCQLFNELNARKPEKLNILQGILKHKLFMGISGSTLVLQVILVEFLNKFASTVKLSWDLWLVCIVIGLLTWPIALLGKLIPVPKEPWRLFPYSLYSSNSVSLVK